MAFLLLDTITVLSSFPIILGDILQKTAAAAAVDHLVTDGGQFVKRIVHGEKLSDNPGYLLFTAPYKLCEGDCRDAEDNFAMAFPIYVGKKGKEKYKELYARDYAEIHSTKPNAPFRQRPTKKLFTPCPSEVTKEQTVMTTETEATLTEPITVSDTESTLTETPTEVHKTSTLTPASETESTATPTTEIATIFETTIFLETNKPATDMTMKLAKTTTETEVNTVEETTLSTTEIGKETTTTFQSETPTFSDEKVTETEDITFESESDTPDPTSTETKTPLITNNNGVRCPLRICKKKTKATPKIITLVKHDSDNEKLDLRNAQWNSDYSDLRDSVNFH